MVGVDCSSVLLTCAALPVALVVADDSISYVTNFFLQNDPDDDDAPSMLGFTVKSIGIGVVLAAVAVLAALMLDSVVPRRLARGARGCVYRLYGRCRGDSVELYPEPGLPCLPAQT